MKKAIIKETTMKCGHSAIGMFFKKPKDVISRICLDCQLEKDDKRDKIEEMRLKGKV